MNTKITYLGGATFIIEVGPFRFLTDPGFDPEGTEKSEGPGHDLKKVMGPSHNRRRSRASVAGSQER